MKNHQQAADDVGTIAETVETLGMLLDKLYADHGDELGRRLERAWPGHNQIGPLVVKPLYALERELTPPD